MAWILPKGSTIYDKEYLYPGVNYKPIKTTSRDRKISDEAYGTWAKHDTIYDMRTGWIASEKRLLDYMPCTGGYCKIDDLVNEASLPAKPSKAATPAPVKKPRKTPFRSLFVKGSEWKFTKDCTINIFREYEVDYSGVIWSRSGSTGTVLEEIKEVIRAEISAGVIIKPLSKATGYYPDTYHSGKGVITSCGIEEFNGIQVDIGDFKTGKVEKDGVERKVIYWINPKDIDGLIEQTNDFTPKAYVVEVDGEMYQENIYGGHPSKSEFVHMNPNPAKSATSWVTSLGIGCTSQYSKAKKYKTLQAAKAGIMYMTGYTEGADGIDYWTEGGGFTDWKKKWRISTWDKTTKTKVDDVDVTEWVYDLFKYRDLVQEYGAGTREIIKRLQAGEKFEAVMVLERWDGGEPVYDELFPEEKKQVSDLLKETILDKGEYLVRSKESSVTVGFRSIGDAMMFKLAYSGTLGIRMFDLEKMEKVI